MTGWTPFALALSAFYLAHALPTRPRVKAALTRWIGARGFGAGYGLLSLGLLAWAIAAAGRAPVVGLWSFGLNGHLAALVAMALACALAALATGAPNPLSFGGAGNARFDPEKPGAAGIARHPLLWALALWSGSHLIANGDLAHIILFGGFLGFALIGMPILDRRHRARLGEAQWRRLAARTSNLPLGGLIKGARGLPQGCAVRLVGGMILYGTLLALHPWVIGVSPLAGLFD